MALSDLSAQSFQLRHHFSSSLLTFLPPFMETDRRAKNHNQIEDSEAERIPGKKEFWRQEVREKDSEVEDENQGEKEVTDTSIVRQESKKYIFSGAISFLATCVLWGRMKREMMDLDLLDQHLSQVNNGEEGNSRRTLEFLARITNFHLFLDLCDGDDDDVGDHDDDFLYESHEGWKEMTRTRMFRKERGQATSHSSYLRNSGRIEWNTAVL